MYVADRGTTNRVQKFNSSGTFVARVRRRPVAPPPASTDAGGTVYVTDSGNDRVQRLSHERCAERPFGGSGDANGGNLQFDDPIDVSVSTETGERLRRRRRQQPREQFNSTGTSADKWDASGVAAASSTAPQGVATGSLDRFFVSDARDQPHSALRRAAHRLRRAHVERHPAHLRGRFRRRERGRGLAVGLTTYTATDTGNSLTGAAAARLASAKRLMHVHNDDHLDPRTMLDRNRLSSVIIGSTAAVLDGGAGQRHAHGRQRRGHAHGR